MSRSKKWHWKSIAKEVIKVLLLVFILSNIMSYIRAPELASTQLPKIEAQLLDGSMFTVEEGKPLLLHYWAVWCPTCKLEAPNIESVSKEYNVLTIAVNSGSDAEVTVYMQEYGLSFNVINDVDGIWAKRFKIEAYPTTFIYDSKGELRFTEVGYTTTAGLLARLKMIE
jgi:thiol-disulfide isomerase/thioredoxin